MTRPRARAVCDGSGGVVRAPARALTPAETGCYTGNQGPDPGPTEPAAEPQRRYVGNTDEEGMEAAGNGGLQLMDEDEDEAGESRCWTPTSSEEIKRRERERTADPTAAPSSSCRHHPPPPSPGSADDDRKDDRGVVDHRLPG